MSKQEALRMVFSQIYKADVQYNEFRNDGNAKGMAEQKLVIQALLMAEDVIKQITEI